MTIAAALVVGDGAACARRKAVTSIITAVLTGDFTDSQGADVGVGENTDACQSRGRTFAIGTADLMTQCCTRNLVWRAPSTGSTVGPGGIVAWVIDSGSVRRRVASESAVGIKVTGLALCAALAISRVAR